MSTSTVLFLTAVLCGPGFATVHMWVQADGHPSLKTIRWKGPALVLACCTAFGGLAYFLDSDVADTTLDEIDVEGSSATVPDAIRFDIPVEHAGVAHKLLDESAALQPRCDSELEDCTWDSFSRMFTPATTGRYTLVVTLLASDVPDLHVRVEDPERSDGHRALG